MVNNRSLLLSGISRVYCFVATDVWTFWTKNSFYFVKMIGSQVEVKVALEGCILSDSSL